MGFSERDKLKALAIVKIFETGKPAGDYTAVAVLDDGAGISYGINQFTHKSGSLGKVIEKYLYNLARERERDSSHGGGSGEIGVVQFEDRLPDLRKKSAAAISKLAGDSLFKAALRNAGKTPEMQAAQRSVMETMYLRPAIEACEGDGFTLPLSLAVIYDSINHGSFEKIRDRVRMSREKFASDTAFEQAWISTYVTRRDAWLESVPRLKKTDYRTDFFLAQIDRENWQLDLPVWVHGFHLTDEHIKSPAVETPAVIPPIDPTPSNASTSSDDTAPLQDEPGWAEKSLEVLETAGRYVETIGRPIDRAAGIGDAVRRRSDSVKSMWATVGSTIWQAIWAVAAFVIGLPIEVWLVVALVAAVFGLVYLYRQISLAKIREGKQSQ